MTDSVKQQIPALVDLETKVWDKKNPDLFLSMIHPDMAWPWPPTANAHNGTRDGSLIYGEVTGTDL